MPSTTNRSNSMCLCCRLCAIDVLSFDCLMASLVENSEEQQSQSQIKISSFEWVTALLLIDFDDTVGQEVKFVYPKGMLSESFMKDLKMLSMPDCLEAGSHEFQFMIRLRDKSPGPYSETTNCFVSFSQYKDASSRRGYKQQSAVLVSQHPFTSLFYNILDRLTNVIYNTTQTVVDIPFTSGSTTRHSSSVFDSLLQISFEHFKSWPDPRPLSTSKSTCTATSPDNNLTTMYLPFYGELYPFKFPSIPSYYYLPTKNTFADYESRRQTRLNDFKSEIFGEINVVKVLRQTGLLPHIWDLWEMIVTGKDIIVYSPNCAVCSTVVTTLVSLSNSVLWGGEYRPYINGYDSDLNLIASCLKEKYIPLETYSDSTKITSYKAGAQTDGQDAIHEHVGAVAWSISEPGFRALFDPVNWQNQFGRSFHVDETDFETPSSASFILGLTNPFLLRSFPSIDGIILIPGLQTNQSQTTNYSLVGAVSNLFFATASDDTRRSSTSSAKTTSRKSSTSYNKSSQNTPRIDNDTCLGASNPHSSRDDSRKSFSPFRVGSSDEYESAINPTLNSSSTGTGRITRLKVVSQNVAAERIYDEWQERNASRASPSLCKGLVAMRSPSTITPDNEVFTKIQSLSTTPIHLSDSLRCNNSWLLSQKSSNQQNSLSDQLFGFLQVGNDINPAGSHINNNHASLLNRLIAESCIDEFELNQLVMEGSNDEQSIVGNMLLRKHFLSLNDALMLPFRLYFESHYATLTLFSKNLNPISTCSRLPQNSNMSSVPLDLFDIPSESSFPMFCSYQGDLVMTLYNNPACIFNPLIPLDIMLDFSNSVGKKNMLPKIFQNKSVWMKLTEQFVRSKSFRIWFQNQKEEIEIAVFLELCKHCLTISTEQLLFLYAIERKVEKLSKLHYELLIQRIHLTIYLLDKLNRRFYGNIENTESFNSNDQVGKDIQTPKGVNGYDKKVDGAYVTRMLAVMRCHLENVYALLV